MIRVSRTAVLLLLLSTFTTGEASYAVEAPDMVSVVVQIDEVAITWTPPREFSTDISYNIYGLDEGATLLGTTDGTHFKASFKYKTYGVSSVVDGVESRIRTSCLTLNFDSLPPAYVSHDCPPKTAL